MVEALPPNLVCGIRKPLQLAIGGGKFKYYMEVIMGGINGACFIN